MKFSPDELRMIERLRKSEAQSCRWRWFLVVFCTCMLVVGVAALLIMYQFAGDFDSKTPIQDRLVQLTGVAYFLPLINMWFMGWLFCLGIVLCRWHGDAKTRLLLSLTDELQKRDH
jgi:hypothetical protein